MTPRDILENHARGLRYIVNLQYHKAIKLAERVDYSHAKKVTFVYFIRDEASYMLAHQNKAVHMALEQHNDAVQLRSKNKYWVLEHEHVVKQIFAYDRGEYKVSH